MDYNPTYPLIILYITAGFALSILLSYALNDRYEDGDDANWVRKHDVAVLSCIFLWPIVGALYSCLFIKDWIVAGYRRIRNV